MPTGRAGFGAPRSTITTRPSPSTCRDEAPGCKALQPATCRGPYCVRHWHGPVPPLVHHEGCPASEAGAGWPWVGRCRANLTTPSLAAMLEAGIVIGRAHRHLGSCAVAARAAIAAPAAIRRRLLPLPAHHVAHSCSPLSPVTADLQGRPARATGHHPWRIHQHRQQGAPGRSCM